MTALAPEATSRLTDDQQLVERWRTRIAQAKDHRKQFEPVWLSNLAFAAGQQWQVWSDRQKRMVEIQSVDPRYSDRDLYTADRIREFLQSAMGELGTDDDRPELLTAQEGEQAEQLQREINDAVAHAWEHEIDADQALRTARRMCLTMGVSAVRCRRDASKGPVETRVPTGSNGQAQLDQATLDHLAQNGTLPDGSLPKYKQVKQGVTVWQPLSAFELLTPPGVTHEGRFPWEVIVQPVLLDDLIDEYPKAAGLVEDTDIAAVIGLTSAQQTGDETARGKLRGHAWRYLCYTRPCRSLPQGQTVVLAGAELRLLEREDGLPYQAVDGTPRSGVHYFHWWRLDDRFHSRSLVEAMKDGQRVVNEMATTSLEIIRRGYPKVFVKEGDLPHNPQGLPLEKVELKQDAAEPNFFAGIGPGDWMWRMKLEAAEDLGHASTLSPLRLGENPQNVDTYSQLALLNENEQLKRSDILADHNQSKAALVEDTVWDIRRYWPKEKLILVSGEDDRIAQQTFEKSKIPDFYVVRVPSGSAKPRSQGAELKLIDAVWAAAVECGVTATDPEAWTHWYADSLKAGQALELPQAERSLQEQWAAFENQLILNGEPVTVAEEDLPAIHIPEHREGQIQARAAGNVQAYMRFVEHVQEHVAMAQQQAAKVAAAQQTPAPPGLTPGSAPDPNAAPSGQPSGQPVFAKQDFGRLAAGN